MSQYVRWPVPQFDQNPGGGGQIVTPAVAAAGTTLSPASLDHTRALGSLTVNPSVAPAGQAHTRALGAPKANPSFAPAGLSHTRAQGSLVVTSLRTLSPAGLTHTRTQGGPVVNPQAKPASLTHTRALGTAYIAPAPAGQVHTRAQGLPKVNTSLKPAGLSHTRAQGALTVSPQLRPASLAHTRTQGAPVVTAGFFVSLAALSHTRAQGAPKVNPKLAPSGQSHSRSLGSPSVGLGSRRALGDLTVSVSWIPRPVGQAHVRATGNPTARGLLTLAPAPLEHTRAQGIPQLSARVLPAGLQHTRAQGAPSVNRQTTSPPSLLHRYGVDFNGTTAYMQATDSASLRVEANNAFSWALWTRLDSLNNNVLPRFWEKRSHYVCFMGDAANGKYRQVALEIADSAGIAHEYWGRVDLNTGAWTHIAGTYDGATDTCRMWINGVEDTVDEIHPGGAFNGTLQSTTGIDFYLARRRTDLLRNLDGALSDVRLWNRALSPSEITDAYSGTVTTTGLIADWDLDEGSGTTATDDSGNGNTGTLTSPVWLTGRALGTPATTVQRIVRPDSLTHVRTVESPVIHGRQTIGPPSLEHARAQGTPTLSGRALPAGIAHFRVQGVIEVNLRTVAPQALDRV